jgi:hypothetical protein
MSDVYVYYFTGWDDPPGENNISARRATLDTIKGRGEAIMESQMVVDHTELDDSGFHIVADGVDSVVKELNDQIRSVELRAASRDSEAEKLNEATDGKDKYMLSLESRELRLQARRLAAQRAEAINEDMQPSAAAMQSVRKGE